MESRTYDVIIVGAGIGGLTLAQLLNDSDLNVLLLERRPTVKKLQNHVYGTPWEYIEKWKLEKYVLNKCGFGLYGPTKRSFREMPKTPFTVVDMALWAESMSLSCDIRTTTRVERLRREHGVLVLIDQNDNEFRGRIIVDCSGDSQVVGKLFGIQKSACDFLDYAAVFDNVHVPQLSELFYFQDVRLTNCGGWYHPLSKSSALLGLSEWTYADEKKYLSGEELKKRFEKYVKNFYPLSEYLKDATIREVVAKRGPTTTLHSSIVEDNYLAVGDAAGAGTPFIGLGFNVALEMAESAFKTIQQAFRIGDVSKKTLALHAKNFHEEFGRWYKWSYFLRFMILRYVTNREIDLMVKRAEVFSNEEYYAIVQSWFTPRMLFKLFRGKGIWSGVLKNMFIYHMLQPLGIARMQRRPFVLGQQTLDGGPPSD